MQATTKSRQLGAAFVTGEELLTIMFTAKSRPSIRWLKYQKAAGRVPFIRVAGKVWYDVDQVREKFQGAVN
jgi:hypothetical protein